MKKKKKKLPYIITGAVMYLLFTFGWFHYFAIKAENPKFSMNEVFDALPGHMIFHPFSCFPPAEGSASILLMFTLAAGFAIFFMVEESKMKKHDGPNVKGGAHFLKEPELKEYLNKYVYNVKYGPKEPMIEDLKEDGTSNGKKLFKKEPPEKIKAECERQGCIVSKSLYLSFDNNWCRKNTNALIIGTAGSGKSRYYVGPNILQANTNYIITDPAGELYRDYAKFLENEGYDVRKLDLNDMYDSERYNPLKYIEDEKDVFTIVNSLIENLNSASGGGGKEEPIWKNSKEALIRATIFYLWEYEPKPERKTLTNILKLINSAKMPDDEEDDYQNPFDMIFEKIREIDPDSQAVTQYDIFKSAGSGKTRDSILITTTSQLSLFGSSNVAHLTEKDEMNLDTFADKKSAIFLCIPTEDNTFNVLASLLYSQLFLTLYNYAEKRVKYGHRIYMEYTDSDGVYHEENLKVFQAHDKESSEEARQKADALYQNMKKGLKIDYSEEKDLYYIKSEDGTVLTWRGSKEAAEHEKKLIEKHAVACPCVPDKLPEHCHFILDEFANIGKIPTFCEKLSTIRKYRINCSIIIQSPDQLKNMYEKEWNVIVDNSNIKLFLGTNSYETAKWISEMLGNKTVTVRNESWNSGNSSGSESFNKDSKPVLSPDEVLAMKDYECVAMIYGGYNIKEQKYEITTHPNYKKSQECKGKFVALREKKKVDTRDKRKLFSESMAAKEDEIDKEQDGKFKDDIEIIQRNRSFENSRRKDISKQDMSNLTSVAYDSKSGFVSPSYMEKTGIKPGMSVEEMENKLESSSCVTDFGPEDMLFDTTES